MTWNRGRGRFTSREGAFRIKKPLWACTSQNCGWVTMEGKTRECNRCHSPCEHFDSEGEFHKYRQLQLLQAGGRITDLERQVRYDVYGWKGVNEKPALLFFYKADFRYKERGEVVVADYKPEVKKTEKDPKGERALSPEFILKRRAIKAVYGIEIKILTT